MYQRQHRNSQRKDETYVEVLSTHVILTGSAQKYAPVIITDFFICSQQQHFTPIVKTDDQDRCQPNRAVPVPDQIEDVYFAFDIRQGKQKHQYVLNDAQNRNSRLGG